MKILSSFFLFAAVVALLTSCGDAPQSSGHTFTQEIKKAHSGATWDAHDAIQADIAIMFGGRPPMKAQLLMKTNSSAIRLRKEDGTILVFKDNQAFISPSSAAKPRERFNLLTWPYFFAAPFKVDDPGTQLADLGEKILSGEKYDAAKLTFNAKVGDSPEDWYILYRTPDENMLYAMAYIVTFGDKNLDEANAEPHAISYHKYEDVDGVKIAKKWKFWMWDEETGLGKELGGAEISNLQFVQTTDADFTLGEDSAELTM